MFFKKDLINEFNKIPLFLILCNFYSYFVCTFQWYSFQPKLSIESYRRMEEEREYFEF
jgi:hypothetical protein